MTQVYKPKEFADIIKVSVRTLSRWDEDGKFVARRNPTGGKFYTDEDLNNYLSGEDIFFTEEEALGVLTELAKDDIMDGLMISLRDFKRKLSVK